EMPFELGVLGGDDRMAQQRVDIVVADDDPALSGEFADDLAVGSVNARDRARRVVVERGDLREIAGVGKQHAAQDPQHRDADEEPGDAGVARDADDYMHDQGLWITGRSRLKKHSRVRGESTVGFEDRKTL